MKRIANIVYPSLAAFAFACLRCPAAQAVVRRRTEATLGTTQRKGKTPFSDLTTGAANTAVGWFSLGTVTTGSYNTALGGGALVLNTGDQIPPLARRRFCSTRLGLTTRRSVSVQVSIRLLAATIFILATRVLPAKAM